MAQYTIRQMEIALGDKSIHHKNVEKRYNIFSPNEPIPIFADTMTTTSVIINLSLLLNRGFRISKLASNVA
jgi:hypothetical protein